MTEVLTIHEHDTGCWFDSHRGHYILRDIIQWAVTNLGYIIDPCLQFVLNRYERDLHEDDYPVSVLDETVAEIEAWLNGGPNTGIDRPIKGQNSPPVIPEGYSWSFHEGDFGLYEDELLEG